MKTFLINNINEINIINFEIYFEGCVITSVSTSMNSK